MNLIAKEAEKTTFDLCQSQNYFTSVQSARSTTAGKYEVSNNTAIEAKLDALYKLVNDLSKQKGAVVSMAMCAPSLRRSSQSRGECPVLAEVEVDSFLI